MIYLGFLLLVSNLWAQGQPFYNNDFSGGLNTYQSSLLINQNESPDLQNVIIDKSGSLDRRQGYTQQNTTAIGGGSNDINNLFDFETSNGTKYCVAFSSTTGYYSTDGCQTFTVFVSTLTSGNDVSCDSLQDTLVCVNNQYNFSFVGTATSRPLNGSPSSLQYIRQVNNQCFAAGATGNLSRLYYSNINDCTTWNTSTQNIDIAPGNGDVITGIGPAIYGGFTVYKKFSTWYVTQVGSNGNGPVFQVVNISPTIGAKNHRSIQNLFTEQLFDSVGPSGGQFGIYAFNGITVYEKTKKLRNSIDNIGTVSSTFGQLSFNTQSQWKAGNLCMAGQKACLTLTQNPGFLQPATTTFLDMPGSMLTGTLINLATTSANTISLVEPQYQTFLNGGAVTDGSTNWTLGTGWTREQAPSGNFFWNNGTCTTTTLSILDINNNILFSQNYTCNTGQTDFLCQNGSTNLPGNNCPNGIPLPASISSAVTIIKVRLTIGSNSITSVPFIRGSSLQIYVAPGSGACGSVCGFNFVLFGSPDAPQAQFPFSGNPNNFGLAFNGSGSYQSPIFDTSFSSPVWGIFNSNLSSSSVATINFSGSASSNGTSFGTFSSLTNQNAMGIPNQEFVIYYATFTVNTATNTTAAITSDTIIAASTGSWQSAETFTSQTMSAWKLFQTNQTTTGNGSITYSIKTSTYSGGSQFSPSTVITPGSAITASTGAYITLISTFSVLNSTETASLSNATLNWQQGGSATTPSSAIFANRYHYGCVSKTGTINDTIYVMDTNGSWVLWNDVFPRSLAVINQTLMMGGSQTSSGGFIYQMYNSDADNGGAISAYYNTKDMPLTDISHIKSIDRLILAYGSNATNLNLDLFRDTNQADTTFTFNTNTTSLFGVDFKVVQPSLNGNTFRVKFSNNAANAPWRVLGYGLTYTDLGIMQPF